MNEDGPTRYGFKWGQIEVIRRAEMPNERRVIAVEVNGEPSLHIYVSKTGRSVRVFDERAGRELT